MAVPSAPGRPPRFCDNASDRHRAGAVTTNGALDLPEG
jgi:hypothetical protein